MGTELVDAMNWDEAWEFRHQLEAAGFSVMGVS